MSSESRTQAQTAAAEQLAGEAEERVVRELAAWARVEGLQMTGEGGLLARLTKRGVRGGAGG